MGIKIIFSSKNGPDWAGPGFQSLTHLKSILILKEPLSDPAHIYLTPAPPCPYSPPFHGHTTIILHH